MTSKSMRCASDEEGGSGMPLAPDAADRGQETVLDSPLTIAVTAASRPRAIDRGSERGQGLLRELLGTCQSRDAH